MIFKHDEVFAATVAKGSSTLPAKYFTSNNPAQFATSPAVGR
jgi:hypothetical protein